MKQKYIASQEIIDKAFERLLSSNSNTLETSDAVELVVNLINADQDQPQDDSSKLLNPITDREIVKQAFAIYQGKLTHQDVDPKKRSAVLKFIFDYKSEKELPYYEATKEAPTLGDRVDKAWRVLTVKSSTDFDKNIAKEFLCYILDIEESSSALSEQLRAAMHLRKAAKQKNPDYIPGHAPLPVVVESAAFVNQVDKAWRLYSSPESSQQQKAQSQAFLIYALNIGDPKFKLHNQITTAMALRHSLKDKHPNFVPGRSVLPKDAIDLEALAAIEKTVKFKHSDNPTLQSLFDNSEILDVTQFCKAVDQGRISGYLTKAKFFDACERDQFRVDIRRGLFARNRALFSTKGLIAHGKQNFAGFTVNLNGEISIFNHQGSQKTGIAHSSMNNGKPIFCPGELKIKDGKLLAVTDYSGHYRPSLYNMYKVLDYFVKRGIDISETKLLTMLKPSGVEFERSKKYPSFYECRAHDLLYAYKSQIRSELLAMIKTLQTYYKSRSSFWYQLFHNTEVSRQKAGIANDLIAYVQQQEQLLNKVHDYGSYQNVLKTMQSGIDEFVKKNENLCAFRASVGQFAVTMKQFEKQTDALLSGLPHKDSSKFVSDDRDASAYKDIGKSQMCWWDRLTNLIT